MPVRHVALFRFAEGVEPAQVEALELALARLPGAVGELERYEFGRDLGLSGTTWDFAVVADLADAEAYERYRDHPAHVAVIEQHVRPLAAERAAVQFSL